MAVAPQKVSFPTFLLSKRLPFFGACSKKSGVDLQWVGGGASSLCWCERGWQGGGEEGGKIKTVLEWEKEN